MAEVATRLEYVFPAVLRASFVLFSVTYSYSVVAFAMYCDTPLGMLPLDDVKGHSMVQRWVLYGYAVGEVDVFFGDSFWVNLYIFSLENWRLFFRSFV